MQYEAWEKELERRGRMTKKRRHMKVSGGSTRRLGRIIIEKSQGPKKTSRD